MNRNSGLSPELDYALLIISQHPGINSVDLMCYLATEFKSLVTVKCAIDRLLNMADVGYLTLTYGEFTNFHMNFKNLWTIYHGYQR
jgi:hypothetical protein